MFCVHGFHWLIPNFVKKRNIQGKNLGRILVDEILEAGRAGSLRSWKFLGQVKSVVTGGHVPWKKTMTNKCQEFFYYSSSWEPILEVIR